MSDVKKVKDWKEKKELINKTQDETPQFEILFEDSTGIKSIKRIKDQRVFDLNINYPAMRGDYFKFIYFNQNKITVEFEIIADDKVFGTGLCPVNDILIQDGFFTDARLEKSIKELALTGVAIMLENKK